MLLKTNTVIMEHFWDQETFSGELTFVEREVRESNRKEKVGINHSIFLRGFYQLELILITVVMSTGFLFPFLFFFFTYFKFCFQDRESLYYTDTQKLSKLQVVSTKLIRLYICQLMSYGQNHCSIQDALE